MRLVDSFPSFKSEYCEQGLLIPTPQGYTYRIEERIESPNIYCNRYMDAMQARSSASTGHAEAAYEISNEGVPGLPHPGDNPIQHGEIAPYTMDNTHYIQQLELVAQYSMDTASDSLDLHSPPNLSWDSDIHDQVHPYGHH